MYIRWLLRTRYPLSNYYTVLGVPTTATHQQIKNKYIQLAKQHHPDTNPHNHQYFQQINQAYQTLKDHRKRLQYNQSNGININTHCSSQQHPYQQHTQSKYPFASQEQYIKAKQQFYSRRDVYEGRVKSNHRILSFVLFIGGFYWLTYYLITPNTVSEFQIRKQNIILSNQNIDSSPTAIQRRKKQYAQEIIDKNIKANVVHLKVRGAGEESTRARQKRLNSLNSIKGIVKEQKKEQISIDTSGLFIPITSKNKQQTYI